MILPTKGESEVTLKIQAVYQTVGQGMECRLRSCKGHNRSIPSIAPDRCGQTGDWEILRCSSVGHHSGFARSHSEATAKESLTLTPNEEIPRFARNDTFTLVNYSGGASDVPRPVLVNPYATRCGARRLSSHAPHSSVTGIDHSKSIPGIALYLTPNCWPDN